MLQEQTRPLWQRPILLCDFESAAFGKAHLSGMLQRSAELLLHSACFGRECYDGPISSTRPAAAIDKPQTAAPGAPTIRVFRETILRCVLFVARPAVSSTGFRALFV